MLMTKDTIKDIIRSGVSTGTIAIDDVLVFVNELLEERLKTALEKADGRILFTEDFPRLASCCFSQVQELDVREIRLENELVFSCEDPETRDIYELNTDDFLIGELRHVLDKIEEQN